MDFFDTMFKDMGRGMSMGLPKSFEDAWNAAGRDIASTFSTSVVPSGPA
jgi:hypothetical protein